MLKLYNTLSRKKEEFVPIKETVGFYSCGPTVYNYAHIGNLRAYICADILKRTLKYNNYKIKHVMNITDVGHLTDDADSGEDKIEKGAEREGKTVWEIADFYTKTFKDDMKKLNIQEPDVWCKATEHIKEMIDMIKKIETAGYTYSAGGNLYFDTSKFKHYSELARLKLDDLKEGARTEVDENKKHPRDFVLWFSLEGSKFGKSHTMKWESPWGTGYPGWHIECCAMSSKYLGNQFDIHSGGIDHIPVHHTNEIAQAETAMNVHPWVKLWFHNNFLIVKEGKMAKSAENFLKLGLLEKKGYRPLSYRYFCLGSHYRSELNFSWKALDNVENSYEKFKNKIIEIRNNKKGGTTDTSSHIKKFESAINDDLNTPVALAVTLDLMNDDKIAADSKYAAICKFDEVLGLNIGEMKENKIEASANIQKLLKDREQARKNKDWKLADELRDKIKKEGFEIEDTKTGPKLKKT
ncbi:MAG: cysteine--tRNA ligase [Elusimicrobia bacterium]|nr:cysteine--tRNA ligase [Elusimicrobiota bacterium]